jgi:hypothetical protein
MLTHPKAAVATAQPGRANLSGTLSEDMPWEMQLYSTENLTAISSHVRIRLSFLFTRLYEIILIVLIDKSDLRPNQ